jgi:transposase
MHVIGEETSQRLDVIPAQFRVIVTHRPKYACRACEQAVVQAPAPERLIKGRLPTEAMVAYVLVAKYAWHLPLYRQAQMLLAQGLDIKRAILAFWVGYAAAELKPLYLRLRELILAAGKIGVDETVVPVLDPGRGRYRVELSQTERTELTALLSGGKHAARKLKRAQILLAADAGASDDDIVRSVGVGGSTVYRTKQRFVLDNLETALREEPRPGASRKLSGKEEALLVATACSKPPQGRARWTLELLAGELVRLTEHDSVSRETVRRRLAENHLKPWRKDMWCIPQVDGEYVARMEDVLDLYAEAPDPKRPVVCFDESPTQLIGEVREPIPAEPGQIERYDCEYKRTRSGRCPWRTSRRWPSSVSLSTWPPRKPATSASTACANSARAPSRKTSVNGSENVPG